MRCTLIVGSILTAGMATTAAGQSVRGRVLDAETRLPVAAVEVRVEDGATGRALKSVVSDSLGRFLFVASAAQPLVLRTRRLGYAESSARIEGEDDDELIEVELVIGMTPLAIEPLRVVARVILPNRYLSANGFYARRSGPAGRFYTRSDIEKHASIGLSEVLRLAPGVRVIPTDGRRSDVVVGRATRPARCLPSVYLDGTLARMGGAPRPTDLTIDDMVMARDVEGVELYHGAAQAPAEFSRFAECGVIVIWTKRKL